MTASFYPSFSYVSGISNAQNAVITFTEDHNFNDGESISFRVSRPSGISNAQNAVITFTEDHNFNDGESISFRVSRPYGMFEINNLQGKILSHTDNTVTVNIDTSFWNTFIYPVAGANTPPVAVPSASGVPIGEYVPTVTLLDAFDYRPD